MTNKTTLFCLVEGETLSRAFSVKFLPDGNVDDLKELIKLRKAPRFDDLAADELNLWKVSIPIVADKHKMITLDTTDIKDELDPRDDISAVFGGEPPKKSDIILVQRPSPPPSGLDPEIAALRKQLSDVFDSSF
ncbi:hypothetical protein BGZ70_004397, partial [Mortierella alpina]